MPVFHESLVQGSAEWLAFRKKCVSATKIAIIMGVSPYKSIFQQWKEDLGLSDPEIENENMREGKKLEPLALEYFNENCIGAIEPDWIPFVVSADQEIRFIASLDGISGNRNKICEIKCGQKSYELAKSYIIPDYYIYQIQWQMFVSDVDRCHYFCYRNDGENIEICVDRNNDLIKKMIPAAEMYLWYLDTITPPPFTDLDYEDRSGDVHWEYLCESYAHADNQEKMGKGTKERIREQMIQYSNGRNIKGSWSKFTKVVTKGRVDYSKVPIPPEIDLEQYRGPETVSYRITVNKD